MDSKTADSPSAGRGQHAAVGNSEPPQSAGTTGNSPGARFARPSRLSANLGASGTVSPPRSPASPTIVQLKPGSPTSQPLASQVVSNQPTQPVQQHAHQIPGSVSAAAAGAAVNGKASKEPIGKDAEVDTDISDDAEGAESISSYDDDDSILDQSQLPWYKTRRLVVVIVMTLSLAVVLAGLLVQLTIEHGESAEYADWESARKAFPWLHFFAAFFPLSYSLHWLCRRLYKAAEWTAIREELYFLRPLQRKIANLLFWLVILAWYQICFKLVWCNDLRCSGDSYQDGLHVVWKLLICLALFSAANFIKCGLARLLAYQFYRTAHFVKVKEAIERELYLIRLSQARSALLPSPPAASPFPGGAGAHTSHVHAHGGVAAWLADKGSMIWQRGSIMFNPHRRTSAAAEIDPAANEADEQHHHTMHMSDTAAREVSVSVSLKSYSGSMQSKQHMQHRHDAAALEDGTPMLPHVDTHSGSSFGSNGQQYRSQLQKGLRGKGSSSSKHKSLAGELAARSREPSFEQFLATRTPSLLGPTRHNGSVGRKSAQTGSRGSGMSLANMVPGVDGLLLQPEVLEATSTAKQPGKAKCMTEQELANMRKALGVNTFGAFVDRYYGLSPKEEAAHVKHVKRFAKGLFYNIKGHADRDFLLPSDFLLFFVGDADSAEDAFNYFDRNGDGSISCAELQESAAEMLRERKNIAASIKDTDSVVDSLETGMGLLIHFIWLVFYLLVWGVNIVQGFTTFSTTVLALTFVFGDSVKSVFESALFLFLEHPYDVGDTLLMNGTVFAKVKKIDLMYTVMLQSSGEMVWHPNSMMRTAVLVNVSRSGTKWEGYSWLVDLETPDDVLDDITAAMKAHMSEQPTQYKGDPVATWRGLEEPFKLRLYVGWSYNFTGEDLRRTRLARFAMLKVVKRELHRLGIKYTLPLTTAAAPYLAARPAQ